MSDLAVRVRALSRALDQAGEVLDHVHADVLDRPTPCAGWDVSALADHLVAAPGRFLAMMRGETPDWAHTPHVAEAWGSTYRVEAHDLLHAWHEVRGEEPFPLEMQLAELAVHAWDLATALGQPVDTLDPEVAERGLAFLRANLTDDSRSGAFGPERPAPEGAGPYERLAAFAGRTVS